MKENFTLSGDKELLNILKNFPEKGYRKPIMSAFGKAGQPVKKAMIASLPGNLKQLQKIMRTVPYKSKEPELGVGAFRKKTTYQNRRGQEWNPYMLIYWFNYGTLSNRVTSHTFLNARKKISSSRNGGIKGGLFMEKAWEASKEQALKVFEEVVDKEIVKFLDKESAK